MLKSGPLDRKMAELLFKLQTSILISGCAADQLSVISYISNENKSLRLKFSFSDFRLAHMHANLRPQREQLREWTDSHSMKGDGCV